MVTVRQDCKFTETSWEKHGDGMVDGRRFKVNILTVRGINFSKFTGNVFVLFLRQR